MMVFGRKCPVCGGKNLVGRPPSSWLASLPTAQSYSCTDCRRQSVQLFFFAINVEKRQFPRKRLPPFFLVRIPLTNQHVRIKDISEGGLCFVQHDNALPIPRHFFRLDLFNCNNGTSLEQLPAKVVATTEQIVERNGFKATVLNHRVRFGNLNQAQRKVLASCLVQYGT